MQSKDILDSIEVTEEDLGKSSMTSGDHLKVTFSRNDKSFSFNFHTAVAFTPTVSDYIDALIVDKLIYESDDNWTVDKFRQEFGYDEDKKTDEDIQAIIDEMELNTKHFDDFFTYEEVECLCKEHCD